MQILDRFIAQLDTSVFDDPLRDNSAFFIGLAAAASIILASKIHEIRPLSVSNFPHFDRDQLLQFEARLLLMIGFQITPQTTPSACARHMLRLWPEVMVDGARSCSTPYVGKSLEDSILAHADMLIGQFWKDLDSLRYAPSTIALSALLLTFSKYKMDCGEWLRRLPDECFPPKCVGHGIGQGQGHGLVYLEHAVLSMDELSFVDIDSCLSAMQQVQSPRPGSANTTSSSADADADQETAAATHAHGANASASSSSGAASSSSSSAVSRAAEAMEAAALAEEVQRAADKQRGTPTTPAELAAEML